jgi:hypothetical protein
MTQDFRAVANMSADEYKKLLEGAAGGVIHAAEIPTRPKYDLLPNPLRFPTPAESQQLDRDWEVFTSRYPALMLNENNGVTIVQFLKANKATASLRNLETAYAELFPELLFTVVTEVAEQSQTRNAGDYRDKTTRKPQSKRLYVSTTAPKAATRKTRTLVVKGRDLTAAEQARLLQPSRDREVNRVEGLSADAFYSEFLDNENDHTPDVIVKRVERAVGEFRSACPDYDPSDPSNREILELYFADYKKKYGIDLPRDNATSYINAWRFYKTNKDPKTGKTVIPVAPTDEVVVNGRKLGKTNPDIHGVDPTFDLNPQLRRRLRAMSSQEYYEFMAQHPEIKKQIDEGGL